MTTPDADLLRELDGIIDGWYDGNPPAVPIFEVLTRCRAAIAEQVSVPIPQKFRWTSGGMYQVKPGDVEETVAQLRAHAKDSLAAAPHLIRDSLCSIAADLLESLAAENAALAARCRELERDDLEWRVMYAARYSGSSLYHDDGELQDNRVAPFIDFRRDSIKTIQEKQLQRTCRALANESESSIPQSQSDQAKEE